MEDRDDIRDELFAEVMDGGPKAEAALRRLSRLGEDAVKEVLWALAFSDDDEAPPSAVSETAASLAREDERLADRLYAYMRAEHDGGAPGREASVFRAGILGSARARGLTPKRLGDLLGLGRSVVAKLDRRLINPASIPARLFHAVAEVLGHAPEDIRAYLALPPALSPAASYRASVAPRLGQKTMLPRQLDLVENGLSESVQHCSAPLQFWDVTFLLRRAAEEIVRWEVAQHSAEEDEAADQRESFAAAVKAAQDMTEEQKKAWTESQADQD